MVPLIAAGTGLSLVIAAITPASLVVWLLFWTTPSCHTPRPITTAPAKPQETNAKKRLVVLSLLIQYLRLR